MVLNLSNWTGLLRTRRPRQHLQISNVRFDRYPTYDLVTIHLAKEQLQPGHRLHAGAAEDERLQEATPDLREQHYYHQKGAQQDLHPAIQDLHTGPAAGLQEGDATTLVAKFNLHFYPSCLYLFNEFILEHKNCFCNNAYKHEKIWGSFDVPPT